MTQIRSGDTDFSGFKYKKYFKKSVLSVFTESIRVISVLIKNY